MTTHSERQEVRKLVNDLTIKCRRDHRYCAMPEFASEVGKIKHIMRQYNFPMRSSYYAALATLEPEYPWGKPDAEEFELVPDPKSHFYEGRAFSRDRSIDYQLIVTPNELIAGELYGYGSFLAWHISGGRMTAICDYSNPFHEVRIHEKDSKPSQELVNYLQRVLKPNANNVSFLEEIAYRGVDILTVILSAGNPLVDIAGCHEKMQLSMQDMGSFQRRMSRELRNDSQLVGYLR